MYVCSLHIYITTYARAQKHDAAANAPRDTTTAAKVVAAAAAQPDRRTSAAVLDHDRTNCKRTLTWVPAFGAP